MLLSILTFILFIFILYWLYNGYLLFLFLYNRFNSNPSSPVIADEKHPDIYLIVPTYNEEKMIIDKIENIRAAKVSNKRLHVIFVDGGSIDNTSNIIQQNINNESNWHFIQSSLRGKINQLNFALGTLDNIPPSSIIVNSDVDALLDSNSVELIAETLAHNVHIGLVGGNIHPSDLAIGLESQHWLQQNRWRMIESVLYSCSSVVAPCYGFRRNLIDRFPDDCIADDLYLAYFANSKGLIVKYLADATGQETRAPENYDEYIIHKFRKTNACLKEAFRFLTLIMNYPLQWKVIYSVKVLQLILSPFIIIFLIADSIVLLLEPYPLPAAIIIVWGFFIASIMVTTRKLLKMAGLQHKDVKKNIRGTPFSLIVSLILMTLIVIASIISYPFYQQNSCYTKVSPHKDGA